MQKTMQQMYRGGVLLCVDTSFWRGMKPLKAKDLGLQETDVPKLFLLGSKFIVPKEEIDKFNTLVLKVRYNLQRLAFPFPVGDFWFVPNGTQEEVFTMLGEVDKKWEEVEKSFLSRYDTIVDTMVAENPELAESILSSKPKAETLRGRFHFKWMLVELFPVRENEDPYQVYRQEMDTFLEDSFQMLKESVLTAAKEVYAKVEEGGATKASIKKVLKAVDRFKAMNFLGNTDTDKLLTDLVALLPIEDDIDPNSTLPVLQKIQDAAKALNQGQVLSNYKRSVQWD